MRNIILFIAFLSLSDCFSQDLELRATPFIKSKIIYKDSTSEKGFLKFASSIFSPRLKKEEGGKSRKINYKLIDKIITNPETENERVFQYLYHNQSKFRVFVELIYSDVLSIYASLGNNLNLFYSDFNRQSAREIMNRLRIGRESGLSESRVKLVDTLQLPNKKIKVLPLGYAYFYHIGSLDYSAMKVKPRYYLLKEGTTKLYLAESNERFLIKAAELISDCTLIINELEQQNIDLEDLPRFIEYYKNICLENSSDEN
ncbi:hypothetical protein [Ulvibacter litoralis]|uniref:Uncharacterized protein n=1 Tax=Ulvibacter litoralis TaxID=227084 RepID=A0A1G7JVI0_9FLAO|nr:hypothetical protein [Ulvibacter litoralis]GHC66482.1 hypothetical protein GCM10008083_34180 [Ulvibacter litoralis]SDF28489.1 hypothetical protein SAMN05421855_1301 [Ulvibacter litoralis]